MFELVTFTDCTFGKGTGSYQYAYCRPYNDSIFTNCVFEEGYEFDATKASSTFVNCYYGKTLIIAENVVSLLGEDAAKVKFPYSLVSNEDLREELVSGGYVMLNSDVTVNGGTVCTLDGSTTEAYGNKVGFAQYGGVLDGNGKPLTDLTNDTWLIITHGGVIKNLTIANGQRGIVTYCPTQNVIIDNIVVDGPGYAINTAEQTAVV